MTAKEKVLRDNGWYTRLVGGVLVLTPIAAGCVLSPGPHWFV